MRDPAQEKADRLRIAAGLLALPEPAAMAAIRTMPAADRAHLTTQINWVQDYEGYEALIEGRE